MLKMPVVSSGGSGQNNSSLNARVEREYILHYFQRIERRLPSEVNSNTSVLYPSQISDIGSAFADHNVGVRSFSCKQGHSPVLTSLWIFASLSKFSTNPPVKDQSEFKYFQYFMTLGYLESNPVQLKAFECIAVLLHL